MECSACSGLELGVERPEAEGSTTLSFSDFIWPFLRPYMGVIPNPKMAFIFPISCILALILPILIKYFPNCVGKGSFPKSQIKSLSLFRYLTHKMKCLYTEWKTYGFREFFVYRT